MSFGGTLSLSLQSELKRFRGLRLEEGRHSVQRWMMTSYRSCGIKKTAVQDKAKR